MVEDAYAGLCVHGTLPLVRDRDAPAGVRFAVPGRDPPSDCVRVPETLPDAEMTLRAFRSVGEVDPYLAALAEHGGNAFSSVVATGPHGAPVALVVRHDRPRAGAATVDGAIRLVSPVSGLAQAWAAWRASAEGALARKLEAEATAALWRVERAELHRAFDAIVLEERPDGIAFSAMSGVPPLTLVRAGDGYALRWTAITARLHADLARSLSQALSALAVSSARPGAYETAPTGLDGLRPAIEVVRRAELARDRVEQVAATRDRLAAVAASPGAARVLARAVSGFPVLSFGSGTPASQASPRTGTPQVVPDSLLARLSGLGLLAPAWVEAGRRFEPPRAPSLYVATEAARDLAAGRVEAAADRVGRTNVPIRDVPPAYAGTIGEALAALAAEGPSEALASAAAASAATLPADGATMLDGRRRGHESWTPVVLCALAGTATLDPEGRLALDGAEPPGIRGRR